MVQKAIVYSVHNKYLTAKTENKLIKVLIPTNSYQKPVIGDFITFSIVSNQFLLKTIEPRTNFLIRPKAANINHIIIIYDLNNAQKKFLDLLWWTLMYEIQGFDLSIIFSKSDLMPESDKRKLEANLAIFDDLNIKYYDYHSSCEYLELLHSLKHKFIILAGNSGAGKSTFINHLSPQLTIKTNIISEKSGRGKHTTTNSYIYEINEILIADAPGFSNLNFYFTPQELKLGWKKFQMHALNCRFRDCMHVNEGADCGIIKAVASKEILEETYQIFLKFINKNKKP